MGSMFRSEEMALCQLFVQPETAYNLVAALGEAGIVEFRDLNPGVHLLQRKFNSELRRCNEIERQLRYIETQIKQQDITIAEFNATLHPPAPKPRDILDYETQFEKIENELVELSRNAMNLKENYLELIELKEFLEKTTDFLSDNDVVVDSIKGNLLSDDQNVGHCSLDFVAGTIPRARIKGLELMLWRITRGNIFMRQTELVSSHPDTTSSAQKSVFVAFFLGQHMKSLLQKVCTSFRASIFYCPIHAGERSDMLKNVLIRLEDTKRVLNQTQDHLHNSLLNYAQEISNWQIMIRKMKAVYYTMNLFSMDTSQNYLISECWVPTSDLEEAHTILSDESTAAGSSIKSFLNVIQPGNKVPPTLNRTNKFTSGFQNLIDAYGVSSYREVNPALYTIITFPFLFAVMFGDIGHGLIMALFALWMVVYEKTLKNIRGEIWDIFFGGRYIILLMGIFSLYTGFVYNDIFSKSMNIFGSSWKITNNTLAALDSVNHERELNPSSDELTIDYVYPIGLDPAWQLAKNKIVFLNTYKMKLSIIFGVAHMIFGVAMSVVNMVHFNHSINIFLEFVPQMLFLLLLFAYLTFMIFFKWVAYGGKMELQQYSPGCAPSVLILFINMMLFGNTKPLDGCKEFMFESQFVIQVVLVVLALLCIPWMLLGKPIYTLMLRRKHDSHSLHGNTNLDFNLDNSEGEQSNAAEPVAGGQISTGHGNEGEPMSEIFILSAIHTIEYVLSTISHTASYLRLWALSLAHAQLSDVLWNRLLVMGFFFREYYGAVFIFIIFSIWVFFTLAILVMMEGLSAFLHTLRLHWVEFMSKFYEGLGHKFQPFSFKAMIDAEDNPHDSDNV